VAIYWPATLSRYKATSDDVLSVQALKSWQLPIVDTAGFGIHTVGKVNAVRHIYLA
jgi:hypothetical protein